MPLLSVAGTHRQGDLNPTVSRNGFETGLSVLIYVLSAICYERPLQNGTFCPISASGSNFNPRNILYIPVVKIFAFLELEQKSTFFKGLYELNYVWWS